MRQNGGAFPIPCGQLHWIPEPVTLDDPNLTQTQFFAPPPAQGASGSQAPDKAESHNAKIYAGAVADGEAEAAANFTMRVVREADLV